jgi:hypothetical protein
MRRFTELLPAGGSQFLLPTGGQRGGRGGAGGALRAAVLEFTLSATQANTEAIRVAGSVTGRSTVLMFDGKYHGQADELLGEVDGDGVVPEGLGVPRDATRHVRLVQYNDLELSSVSWPAATWRACSRSLLSRTPAWCCRWRASTAGCARLASQGGARLVLDETTRSWPGLGD